MAVPPVPPTPPEPPEEPAPRHQAPVPSGPAAPPPGAPDRLPVGFSPLRPDDPATVGPFALVGRVGEGGMGVVYGALDSAGRRTAVKVIKPAHARSPEYRAQFAREADLLSRVSAECAPAFLGAETTVPRPWLATEFVQGGSLSDHVDAEGPLSGPALAAFAAGTAEALAAVHAAGIVHRDVKPANVVLSPQGPRLLDFGIARALDDPRPEEAVYGTPGWVAPERLAGRPATPAADMFAWGALVACAATGRRPFGGGDPDTRNRRVRSGQADLDGVPEDLLPLVRRALSADPAERPTAAEALAAALEIAGAPSEAAGTEPRRRLRSLLTASWQGFGATGRGAGPWVAAASLLAVSSATATGGIAGGAALGGAAGGAGAAGGGAGAAGAAGAGTILGMSKGMALTAALVTATAAVGGGVAAGRFLGDGTPAPSAQTSPSPSDSGEPFPQRAAYRSVEFVFPEDWTVERIEDDFQTPGSPTPEFEEWIAVFPGGGSCDADLTWTYPSAEGCEHVKILGPLGIARGGPGWGPVDQNTFYVPSGDVGPCPEGVERLPYDREADVDPPEAELAPIGALDAYHNEFLVPCLATPGFDFAAYRQRTWLLPESEILVVDNIGVAELPDVLAAAETGN
ncbi:serine/threonine-protein kinase [Streptomonospora nanhaiensis]|uniref:serine/threonine-protein kinase n=1 Tax=Streptomonospora nanhaiensis TaxID=1323731 RepID=UPI001C996D8A|nr:serine/threonine-protein kinase [Streptomonospora nanhaiensis]MBX9390458.1 serine/threonine protein kinase [Streptomonospora nanhaiensis]